jgi:hypothetical protein
MQEFTSHGLWLSEAGSTAPPPTNIVVHYIKGGDETSPTRRTLICVGIIGESLPIYCVSGTSEREITLMLEAFLEGYIAAQSH